MEKILNESYSCSLISQGKEKFYSLTMPSEVLAETCFVSTRDDDPIDGFQRTLDEKRAKEIAEYLDCGEGTIPTAIVLSANLKYNSKNKTIEFLNFDLLCDLKKRNPDSKSFLQEYVFRFYSEYCDTNN